MMRSVICGLALTALSGLAFAQSQPASSDVSERERVLLERIEGLERRLNEVETRLNATVADGRTTIVAPAASRQLPPAAPFRLTPAPPLQLTNVAPRQTPAHPMATTASPQQPTQTGQAQSGQAQTGQAQTARAP